NRVGYIAMDFIDDTPPEMGFRALFSEKGSQQVAPGLTRWLPGFTITLVYLDSKGGGRTVLPLT
ncbi:MAG TPA: hypothetical protein VG892_14545, partial [Terriglobales bacterium]|nr:hypothetical protein [Terriglobales bacterium]